jgi:Transglutaminase-like superfamily
MGHSLRIRTGPDAFLFLRVSLFAAAVPYLMRLKLSRLASVLEPGSEPGPVDPDPVQQIAAYVQAAIRWGRPLVRPGCLTLSLTRYYFFRRAGLDVSLHFGMGRIGENKEFVGHCWLAKDGVPYLETRDPRTLYVEMYRISREDRRNRYKPTRSD